MIYEVRRGSFRLSTDRSRLDVAVIQGFLSGSYWAPNVPEAVVRRSIEGSLCFGIYEGEVQVAFGRVVTDYATFAWIADVFVLEPWRGRGLARWMVMSMRAHPELAGLRRWILATRDAHEVYRRCGFVPLARPERFMEILAADPYGGAGGGGDVGGDSGANSETDGADSGRGADGGADGGTDGGPDGHAGGGGARVRR